jgi:DNA-directed RNA polymerase beta subunit
MNFNQIKQYRYTDNIFINPKGYKGKNILFYFFPENNNFFDVFNELNIKNNQVKTVFIPKVKKPIYSNLSSSYRKKIIEHKLIPKTEIIGGDYSKLIGKNFYFDTTILLSKILKKYKHLKFNKGVGYNFVNSMANWLNGFPQTSFQKVLLYTINTDNYFSNKFHERRIFPIYRSVLLYLNNKIKDVPFDKILLYKYNSDGGEYILLFDKESKINSISKLKSIMRSIESTNKDKEMISSIENNVSELMQSNKIDMNDEEKEKITKIINAYSIDNKSIPNSETNNFNDIVMRSILYNTSSNKSELKKKIELYKNKPIKEVTKISKYIIPKEKIYSISSDKIVKNSRPEELTDFINPKHILDFRKREFKESIREDITDVFKTLEKEDLPLKLKSLEIVKSSSHIGEIDKSYFDVYKVSLEDDNKNIHNIEIQIPTMSDNGTFVLNGMENSLTNQIVTHPIFFFKEFEGKFQSSYASFTVKSKQLKNESYYWMFFGNYKFPLFTLLAYKIGFDKTFKLFNIKYKITDTKSDNSIKLPDGRYIEFEENLSQPQIDLIGSFKKALPSLDKNNDILSNETWQEALVTEIGNRSSIYRLDKTWENIITPIEKKVLSLKDEPTDIVGIIKFMAENASVGRVDDRNDINKQRLRVSELFTAQIQKQVKASYSEYMSKRMAGDDNAKFFMDPRKVLSEILVSQNIAPMESINPLEELSTNTKITPIGIGGLPNTEAYPERARNIHHSYFGNIDPIETPNGPGVGIQQQLSINANITNARGMFILQDKNKMMAHGILGTTASMIPFIETNEPTRLLMATGQAKQAFPIRDPENPAVQSGYESILSSLLSDNFIKKTSISGKVIEVNNDLIVIQNPKNKQKTSISLKPVLLRSGSGKNGLSVFKSRVKVGDSVKENDIVAEGSNIKDGLISNGVNLLAAIMPWKGYNFEDGQIVSQSASKKFVSLHQEEINLVISEEDDIAYIVNENDVLLKGDILTSYSETIDDIESLTHKRTDYGGIIHSVEVYSNVKPTGKEGNTGEHLPEKLRKYYLQFKDYFIKINGKYPEGSFTKHRKPFKGILIKFIVRQELTLTLGDKIQNRYYNKGVVSQIVPDEYMPKLPNGETVDIVYTPLSILNRTNPGQLFELHTGLISRELAIQMNKLDRNKFISLLSKVLDLYDEKDKSKRYSKNLIQYLKKISNTEYNIVKQEIRDKRFFPIIVVPFKAPSRENVLKALSVMSLKPEYKLKIKLQEEDDREIITSPVAVGYMYIFRLEHISDKKLHTRSTGAYQAGTLAATAGKKRDGGVLVGEYDVYGLLAYDAKTVISEVFGSLSGDHATKYELISEIIRTGKAAFRKGKTNPSQDMFVQHMVSMHLTSA